MTKVFILLSDNEVGKLVGYIQCPENQTSHMPSSDRELSPITKNAYSLEVAPRIVRILGFAGFQVERVHMIHY